MQADTPAYRCIRRIRENIDIFAFALDEGEMARLDALDEGRDFDGDPSDAL